MRRLLSLCTVCLILLLSACGGRGKPAVVHNDLPVAAEAVSPDAVYELQEEAARSVTPAPVVISSVDYALGEERLGDTMVPMRGHLAIPTEGKHLPLVFILHGNHGGDDIRADFYHGFSYLTEYLAARGYAAISLDIQSAYAMQTGSGDDDKKTAEIAARQLGFFERANDGESLFPVELTGRLDMEQIIVVGHSRGGDAALNIACDWTGVVGACAVAPNLRVAEKAWRDIPVAILVPQLDGDVSTLDGYAYLYPRQRADLESSTVLTLLEGGNHNFFNARLTQDDASKYGGAALSPAEQQRFLCRYLADFCDAATNTEASADPGTIQAVLMERYDLAVRELAIAKDMVLLTDAERGAGASIGCGVRRITLDSRTTDIHIPLSWGTEHTLTFWEGTWSGSNAVMDLPILTGDFSSFRELALDTAAIVETNGLTLVLTDQTGASAGVKLPALALAQAGDGYQVFSQIRVPLSQFEGVDLQKVTRVSFVGDCGQVWVSALWGV